MTDEKKPRKAEGGKVDEKPVEAQKAPQPKETGDKITAEQLDEAKGGPSENKFGPSNAELNPAYAPKAE